LLMAATTALAAPFMGYRASWNGAPTTLLPYRPSGDRQAAYPHRLEASLAD
jgi:hypothetical protein